MFSWFKNECGVGVSETGVLLQTNECVGENQKVTQTIITLCPFDYVFDFDWLPKKLLNLTFESTGLNDSNVIYLIDRQLSSLFIPLGVRAKPHG